MSSMPKDLETPEEQRQEQEPEEQGPVLQKPRNEDREEEEEEQRQKKSKEEELGFWTPSSSDHKIPDVDTCPPAPRKRRREIFPARKRRLSDDLRFFEDSGVGREEVESFFGGVRRQNGVVKRCRSA